MKIRSCPCWLSDPHWRTWYPKGVHLHRAIAAAHDPSLVVETHCVLRSSRQISAIQDSADAPTHDQAQLKNLINIIMIMAIEALEVVGSHSPRILSDVCIDIDTCMVRVIHEHTHVAHNRLLISLLFMLLPWEKWASLQLEVSGKGWVWGLLGMSEN